MRKKNALKSSLIGLIAKICTIVLAFINTKVFMNELGVEIKGINGILTNCLGLLQLAEMGIGSAIIFALYQPLIDQNIEEIQILMKFYRKMYKCIGFSIIVLGLVMSIFLPWIINDSSYSLEYIRVVFYIQLATTASTYFMAYKRNLLYADQKMYISTFVDAFFNVIFSVINILFIYLFHSYIVYLVIQVMYTVIANLVINAICNKYYPYLKEKVNGTYKNISQLKRNIRDIMIDRVGGVIYSSTDNILISVFCGVVSVGYMAVYYQILSILNALSSALTEPIQPILGNYIKEKKKADDAYHIFLSYTFIRFCIANLFTVGLIVMVNPLISLWLGDEYILSNMIPIMIAIAMYIGIVHGPTGEFITALGLFKNSRNLSFGGIAINLITSILFVQKCGVVGVLIGTAIAQIYYWIARAFIVYKHFFKRSVIDYLVRNVLYIIIVFVEILIINYIGQFVVITNKLLYFLVLGGITITVCVLLTGLIFFNTKEFGFVKQIIGVFFAKRKDN